MCTEKCVEAARGSKVSHRAAMAGAAAVAWLVPLPRMYPPVTAPAAP